MSRYVLTILLAIFSVGGLCSYYVYGAIDRLPQYQLTTVRGDADEAKNIELFGSFGGRFRSEFLTVTADGSDYRSEQSFYKREIDSGDDWFIKELKPLRENDRNFMRGKPARDGFYEDEERLIYADVELADRRAAKTGFRFRAESLDRASGKTVSWKKTLPTQTKYVYITVEDVQRAGNELYVLTSQMPEMDPQQFAVYVFDAEKGDLLRSDVLDHGIDEQEKTEIRFKLVTDSTRWAPNDNVVIQVMEEQSVPVGQNAYTSVLRSEHIVTYSYKTGKFTEAAVPKANERALMVLEGSVLTRTEQTEADVTVSRIDLDSGVSGSITFTAEQLGADTIQEAVVENGKLYILLRRGDIPTVIAADAANGTALYEGKVVPKGDPADSEFLMGQLRLMNLDVSHAYED